MGLTYKREDEFDQLFSKFAKLDDPNAGKDVIGKERSVDHGISVPEVTKNEVNKELVEKERRVKKILK